MAISVTTEEGASVSAPVQADAVRNLGLLTDESELGAQLIDNALALQVPDLDAGLGGGTQPVSVGAKAKGVDDITGVQ